MALVTPSLDVPVRRRSQGRLRVVALVGAALAVALFGLHAATTPPTLPVVAAGENVMFDMQLKSSAGSQLVENWLRAGGLTAATIDPHGTVVHASGTAAQVEARLRVALVQYTDKGRAFHRPRSEPALPPAIAAEVQSIAGLDNESPTLARPNVGGRALDACATRNSCLTRDAVSKAFALQPLYDRNILGTGQTVAVVMNGPVSIDDLNKFDEQEGIAGPIDYKLIPVDPLTKTDTDDEDSGREEATMDVETVHMIAPAAKILYYQSTFDGTGMADAFERVAKDGLASIVTYSVGGCDDAPDNKIVTAERNAIADLKKAHITLFASSGDHGAYRCLQQAFAGHGDPDWTVVGDWPADSPDVVSVGGTYLRRAADDSYESEHAWVSPLTNWSTGGGVSPSADAPSWQTSAGLGPKRQYPDVAAPADPESGWTIIIDGVPDRSSGTSAAAPFWAGYAALVRQEATTARTGTFPFLAPVLYALGNGPAHASVFHDVVDGSNLHDAATPGWDSATGLGSPIGAPLADAIVAYLAQHPGLANND